MLVTVHCVSGAGGPAGTRWNTHGSTLSEMYQLTNWGGLEPVSFHIARLFAFCGGSITHNSQQRVLHAGCAYKGQSMPRNWTRVLESCNCYCSSLVVGVLCWKSQGPQFNSRAWICTVCTAGTQYPLDLLEKADSFHFAQYTTNILFFTTSLTLNCFHIRAMLIFTYFSRYLFAIIMRHCGN